MHRPPYRGGHVNEDIELYYRRRASEYDEVYNKPERQRDIRVLADRLRTLVAGRDVLEVAAGTGFWTAHIAGSVKSILATDAAEETLEVAASRDYGGAEIRFAVSDAFALDNLAGRFDAGLACFWISHLSRDRALAFLKHLGSRLEPRSRVVLSDNRYVEGSNHPISRVDRDGNTYQHRTLASGETFEVMKNFPDDSDLVELGAEVGARVEVSMLEYYWVLSYDTDQ